jgi:Tfp pilus assembly protein FimT
MATKYSAGFTILELMLFLAVTGLLMMGILGGSSIVIGQERYRDSVNSLKSLLQEQYSEVKDVVNSRTGAEACDSTGISTTTPMPRGTSDCLTLGRLIEVNDTGTEVKVSNVVGYRNTVDPVAATDLDELKNNYILKASPIDQETKAVDWEARIVKPATADPQPITFMLIMSPLSGSIMAFEKEGEESDLHDLIVMGSGYPVVNLCIEGSAGTFAGNQMAVRINRFATSPSSIEIPSESENTCV